MIQWLSTNAGTALLLSGTCMISTFFMFLIMYLIERRIEVSSVKKLNLYWNLSLLLLLIGLYQIFTFFILRVPNNPEKSLFFYRLSYFAGIPTIPIFLNVLLTLTIGSYKEIQDPTSKIKREWKRRTKIIWWPMWILTAIVLTANIVDILFSKNMDLFLTARNIRLENSAVPYIGSFSHKFTIIFNVGLFPILWFITLSVAMSLILSYIIRVIWFDKPEWIEEKKTPINLFLTGLFDKMPTVKYIKTFSFLSVISLYFLIFQGFRGYDWPLSFPIMAYSNFFAFFAIIFILFGEVFGAREETIRAYSNAFLSNINSRATITLSHEMGTPLLVIRDLFRRLSKDFNNYLTDESKEFLKERFQDYLAEIKDTMGQVDKLARISGDMKKKAGIFRINLVSVSLKSIVDEVIETVKLNLKGKQITFKIRPDDVFNEVIIDPDQMTVILRNLIENAIYAVPTRDAVIEISWRIGVNVIIEITDNGHGIPRNELKNVEKLYYTTKPPGVGTGLGLSIVKNFIQEIRGSLSIESTPNVGTTITIKFPNINKE